MPSDEPFYNIPPLINKICQAFHGASDEWDPKHVPRMMKLNDNCIEKTASNGSYCSAFGKEIISSGQFHWKFKIENVGYRHWAIVLGIWKVKSESNPPKETYFTHKGDDGGYAFVTDNQKLVNKTGGGYRSEPSKYGTKKVENGDYIDMYLDLDELTLSYAINDQDCGKAFDIEDTAYRMAVNMRHVGTCLRLL